MLRQARTYILISTYAYMCRFFILCTPKYERLPEIAFKSIMKFTYICNWAYIFTYSPTNESIYIIYICKYVRITNLYRHSYRWEWIHHNYNKEYKYGLISLLITDDIESHSYMYYHTYHSVLLRFFSTNLY